jgi:DNA-binding MarR family transcriptional regulator
MVQTPKLTARQETFLQELHELHREREGPVHYSDVARRLGVSPFSAYDMLRVLEKKGFASASYALADGHSGPGRSIVLFAPTAGAAEFLGSGGAEPELGEEWQSVRERVLSKLRQARETSYREVLNDLLARLPEAHAPLTFCTEMIGALLLNMGRVRARAGGLNPFRVLSALRTGEGSGLETLAGLSVGASLAANDEATPSITQRLLEHARGYQANLGRLSEEARSALVQFLEEALEALD